MEERYLIKIEVTANSSLVINEKLQSLGLEYITPRSDHHITIVFATTWKRRLPKNKLIDYKGKLSLTLQDVDIFDNAVVVKVKPESTRVLLERREILQTLLNFTSARDVYTPHITIGYIEQGNVMLERDRLRLANTFNNFMIHLAGEREKILLIG
jgi:2'-5' RNA ligase